MTHDHLIQALGAQALGQIQQQSDHLSEKGPHRETHPAAVRLCVIFHNILIENMKNY